MAGNKKKKKPLSNPARGYATTSTKPKPETPLEDNGGEEPQHVSETTNNSGTSHQGGPSLLHDHREDHVERSLHELSPEEMENQLEESRLQILVDKYGEKVRKDVVRQCSRLQTERRILRTQAQPLSARMWLPKEIMQLITIQINEQNRAERLSLHLFNTIPVDGNISEDDLLIKVWTLRQILLHLGFSSKVMKLALHYLLTRNNCLGQSASSAGKGLVWGLDECLTWLAFAAQPEDLPCFDTLNAHQTSSRTRNVTDSVQLNGKDSSTETSTPTESRPSTSPEIEDCPPVDLSAENSSLSTSETSSVEDAEPEKLVDRFLNLQEQMYRIDPKCFGLNHKDSKLDRGRHDNSTAGHDANVNRRIRRLRVKLDKIKADILFDEEDAMSRWAEMQIQLAKEASARRRLGFNTEIQCQDQTLPDKNKDKDLESEDDAPIAHMFGDLFIDRTASVKDQETSQNGTNAASSNKDIIKVRDFGKWSGMSPRRVFEEACRSRDSSAQISCTLLSGSAVSKRHRLVVYWSREQDYAESPPIDSVSYEKDPRFFKIEMTTTSCPDPSQSEAYVSTVGLFLNFALAAEQKVYLRLPSVWRELWEELSILGQKHQDSKDRDVLRELHSLIEETSKQSDPDADDHDALVNYITLNEHVPVLQTLQTPRYVSTHSPDHVRAIWTAKESSPSYQSMLTTRSNLPIHGFKTELLQAIANSPVVIVCGETGCGKSTQVPTYVLEDQLSQGHACKIYCTEPRRISAISLARRVSEELGEQKGDVGTPRSLVGYSIRLENRTSIHTRLVYATTGIVMRMLENTDELSEVTHLILDEVHERSIESDFLLIVLRKLLLRRLDLKVVLMSATVNAQRFSAYLDDAPVINVPGRTFPVETKYLEDAIQETRFNPARSITGNNADGEYEGDEDLERSSDTCEKTSFSADNLRSFSAETCNALLKYDEYRLNYDLLLRVILMVATSEIYSSYSKAILVFLPGISEIRKLKDMLRKHPTFQCDWDIHTLHSTVAMEEQERAFVVPPVGVRKIVLATNIAETGITIPDVTCVVDTGKHKEMRFDERRQLSRLIEVFISRANAKQRRGRAGRVQKGLCFHLFTRSRHDNIMFEEQTPEMLRLSLQDLVLRVKVCKLGDITQTLSEALDAPSAKNIRRAKDALIDVKALTPAEDLTALGRQLAKLPLDVFLGKMALLGVLFGCVDATVTIAAILSSKSPFSAPMGSRSQMDSVRLAFKKGDSDLLTVYNAYVSWKRICSGTSMSEHYFCRKNFLNPQTLSSIEDLKAQLTTFLADAGFIQLDGSTRATLDKARHSWNRVFVEFPRQYNTNNDNEQLITSVIACSFYPKLLRRDGKSWRNIANNQAVSLHPTSIIRHADRPLQWLSFYHIMRSNNKFYNAHETSPVEEFGVALLCGEADFKLYAGVMVIDGNRIRFSLEDWKTIAAIKVLRAELRSIMAQLFRSPGRALSQQQQVWLGVWEKIFTSQGKAVSSARF